MRIASTFVRIGILVLLGTLLSALMAPELWGERTGGDVMSTANFAITILNEWAFALVILGALLAMAMAGAAYLVRDERVVNLMWELPGGQEE